tara:strand:+ start:94 stop:339 length:246 start_codon:yes stop_codon:yes gene_type:complete
MGGGAKTPEVPKPVPMPPAPQPTAPARQATQARKPIEDPGVTPDVQLGNRVKSSKNRSSIKTSKVGVQAPNTGSKPGALSI